MIVAAHHLIAYALLALFCAWVACLLIVSIAAVYHDMSDR